MGQRIDSSLIQAQSNNAWGNLNLTGLPIVELRPLYRLIYDTKNDLANDPKGFLVDILDIRSHIDTVTGLTQNDHGGLYGLADDDHYQYVHIDNARTIDAVHTFTNGLNASGLINAVSGNFTSLTVNSTGVSLVGHTHASSNITDFSEAVQDVIGANGFLIPGTGINISYNDGANTLTISTTGLQPSGNYSTVDHTHTTSNITDFDSSVSGVVNTVISTDIVAGTGIAITYDNVNDDLIVGLNGLIPVVSLGILSGSNAINASISNAYQTLTLNGTAVTFTKGGGWPVTTNQCSDVILKITVLVAATSITWTIINEWYNQAPAGALAIGTHLFLLRGVGTTIEGHYIGNKTN